MVTQFFQKHKGECDIIHGQPGSMVTILLKATKKLRKKYSDGYKKKLVTYSDHTYWNV